MTAPVCYNGVARKVGVVFAVVQCLIFTQTFAAPFPVIRAPKHGVRAGFLPVAPLATRNIALVCIRTREASFITGRIRSSSTRSSLVSLHADAERESSKIESKRKNHPIPVVLGPIGGAPMLPGALQRLNLPSPMQIKSIEVALTFASLDAGFGSKCAPPLPLLAYTHSYCLRINCITDVCMSDVLDAEIGSDVFVFVSLA